MVSQPPRRCPPVALVVVPGRDAVRRAASPLTGAHHSRPLLPVRLGKRDSGPSNEEVERVDVLLAFGEFIDELPAARGDGVQSPLALASRVQRYVHLHDLGSAAPQGPAAGDDRGLIRFAKTDGGGLMRPETSFGLAARAVHGPAIVAR